MGKTEDKSILAYMVSLVDRYIAGSIDIMHLVQKLENSFRSLNFDDDEWRKKFYEEWIELEIILSAVIERDPHTMSLNIGEKVDINDLLSNLKKIIQEKEFSIKDHFCPSCGWNLCNSPVWDDLTVEHDFCDCCGLKFGRDFPSIQDMLQARTRWLLHPEFWYRQHAKPDDWKIEDQLERISEE